jgi:hypothetical protein
MYTKILTSHSGNMTAINQPYQEGTGEGKEDILVIIEHGPRLRMVRNGYIKRNK